MPAKLSFVLLLIGTDVRKKGAGVGSGKKGGGTAEGRKGSSGLAEGHSGQLRPQRGTAEGHARQLRP